MIHRHCVQRIVQAGAVLLLAYSTIVRAMDCAGGMDATGNECNDQRSAVSVSNAAPSHSKADARILFTKRAEVLAQRRFAEAKVSEGDAIAAVRIAEANLIAARKAVADAQYATRR